MKALNLATLLLVIIGAINWLLVGLANFDVVAAIFGEHTTLSNVIYVIIGLSGIYQLWPFVAATPSPAGPWHAWQTA